jgi:hypothetical protein
MNRDKVEVDMIRVLRGPDNADRNIFVAINYSRFVLNPHHLLHLSNLTNGWSHSDSLHSTAIGQVIVNN